MSDKSKDHSAGNCSKCGLIHSVPEATRLNQQEPQYGNMIRRAEGEADPLIQEPKR